MSNVDEETEQLDLAKIRESVSENEVTSKMAAIAGTPQDTVSRPIPAELLNRSQPSTIKMNAIVDISTSLLEEIPVESHLCETDETREILQVLGLKKNSGGEIVFAGTIDPSGRIQLPAEYLTDSRIRPGRKLKIRIEFTD